MGKNIAWFDSLPKTKQYDLLFSWKKEKHDNKLEFPKETKIFKFKNGYMFKTLKVKETVIIYPASLKHFIEKCKRNIKFHAHKMKVRDATIDILLNKKNKSKYENI